MSLVSRTPSPAPHDGDVDMEDVYKYDEHVRGYAREVVTVEARISSTNKGFGLLAKMGWVEGQPLGLSSDGRVDPIPFSVKNDMTGLGKIAQDDEMIEFTVAQRRNLDSERMRFETQEQRLAREAAVAQKASIQSEINTVLRPFFCQLCDKQFKNVAQYDEHTNSYAHHHKARMKDLQGNHPMRMASAAEADARKEKERKREEKELRKMAKAMGVKMPASASSSSALAKTEDGAPQERKSGWTTFSSPSANATAPPTPPIASSSSFSSMNSNSNRGSPAMPSNALRTSAWQTLSPTPPPPPPANAPTPPPSVPTSAWRTLPSEPPASAPIPQPTYTNTPPPPPPAFKNQTVSQSELFPSDPPPPPRRSGWAPVPPNASPAPSTPRSGWSTIPSGASQSSISGPNNNNITNASPPVPASSSALAPAQGTIPGTPTLTASTSGTPIATPAAPKQSKKAAAAAAEELANKSRGNWQNFKKGFGKR
ncbi:hypothetical protein SCHPADRAFT_903709 [Schizopora paradoxa]|uniref:G-patch domain-containing protein n=1 Tax=Schizopora paradoxa TaxID=27342 RepID=A0A0H2SAR3_9AGAM|nr:hypothetical protein SCHPADRAFT_903709 [Schizopora paradoxa]